MISYGICLSLTCFTQYDNLQFHPCCCNWHYFILWLGDIPFYICICLYLFLCQRTFRLLLQLGYCKQCCNEHWGNMYLLKNDLSVFGCAGPLLLRRLSSSCRRWGCSPVVVPGLSCSGSPVAEHGLPGALASVVVARVLSCSAACAIFPDQELNLRLLHWQGILHH